MKHRLFNLSLLVSLVVVVLSMAVSFVPHAAYAAGANATLTGGGAVAGAGAGAAPTTPPASPKLDCRGLDTPFKWAVCPVVDGMIIAIGKMDNFINSQMTVGSPGNTTDPNQIFCNRHTAAEDKQACNAYHSAWASMRNIALGLMVMAGIAMLIANALGFEALDAYTIRKVLPRLLISAVAITLSWPLMQLAVQFSNDLGYGVRYLIYQPFSSFHNPILGGGAGGIATLLELGALTLLGFVGLLSFLGTAAIAVLIAFLVLILRQLLIVVLIIFAPLAIVAYILPNTQKVYKFWWESFSKALLMFALISALIAFGRVFSVVSGVSSDSTNPIQQLVGFAAYFLPYFLIPATFKFAGSALGSIGGFVNDRGKGAFGGLKQFRGNTRKKNTEALKTGNRLSGTKYEGRVGRQYSKLARGFNTGTRGAANFKNAGYNPKKWSERMGSAGSSASTNEAFEAIKKEDHPFAAFKGDDDIVEAALMYDTDSERHAEMVRRGMTKERADQGVAALHHAQNAMSKDGFNKALLMSATATGSGLTPEYEKDASGNHIWYDSNNNQVAAGTSGASRNLLRGIEGGGAGWRQMINDKLGNDRQGAIAVLGAGRQAAEGRGRFDLVGGSFSEDAAMLEQANTVQAGGGKVDVNQWQHQILSNALEGQSRAKLGSGHNRSLETLAPVMAEKLQEAVSAPPRTGGAPRTAEDAIAQYAFAASSHDFASNSSPEMARHIKQKVLDQRVSFDDMHTNNPELYKVLEESKFFEGADGNRRVQANTTNAEIMEHLRATNSTFGRYRREYGSAREGAAAQGAAPPPAGP